MIGYYSVLVSMIGFKFNVLQTKLAMLAINTVGLACKISVGGVELISGKF